MRRTRDARPHPPPLHFCEGDLDYGALDLALTIQPDSAFITILQASQSAKNLPPTGVVGNLLPWIAWYIWIARNKLLFESKIISTHDTLTQAIKAMREWEQAQTSLTKRVTQLPIKPRPLDLPDSTIFINTDASWKSNSAGLAWIFMDQESSELARKSLALDTCILSLHG